MRFDNVEPGTMFVVPLENGKFAYGYIVFIGPFFWVNIYDFQSERDDAFEEAQKADILIRDLRVSGAFFTRAKIPDFKNWKLKRKIIVDNPLPPEHEHYIIGDEWAYKVISIHDDNDQRPATEEDVTTFQKDVLEGARYYPLLIEASIAGKEVVFDEKSQKFIIQ